MALLILVCGCSLATAIILESRLSLNTLMERAVMIFSLAAGQLLLSIQALSLATCLNGRGLILAGIVSVGLALCVMMVWRAPAGRISWEQLWQNTRAELAAGKAGRFVLALFLAAAGVLGLNAIAGAFMVPLGDPYHFDKPLFWMQNQSIERSSRTIPGSVARHSRARRWGCPALCFARAERCCWPSCGWRVFCRWVLYFQWPEGLVAARARLPWRQCCRWEFQAGIRISSRRTRRCACRDCGLEPACCF